MEAAKEAAFAANIGVGGGELSNLLSEDNPDRVVMITEEGKITFVNKVLVLASAARYIYIGLDIGLRSWPGLTAEHQRSSYTLPGFRSSGIKLTFLGCKCPLTVAAIVVLCYRTVLSHLCNVQP